MFTLHHDDCIAVLRAMPDNSVDSIVTDPPYGLSFMGKRWDYDVPSVEVWAECLRVLKPGGHLLAFAGTRTQHRMAVRIEDAGFEIRDLIAWVYGSGFPKSLDVSKAIDKAAGAEREVVGERKKLQSFGEGVNAVFGGGPDKGGVQQITTPATDAARQWQGWGTALKPALEPITVARKPLIGTVAENVLTHGTGAINVDGCRVGSEGGTSKVGMAVGASTVNAFGGRLNTARFGVAVDGLGRWPANLIHDGSDEVVELFPSEAGAAAPVHKRNGDTSRNAFGAFKGDVDEAGSTFQGDSGSAARFFYCPKASKRDRGGDNSHPTVKPTELMRYLCRLVTPPGGLVLDPFMGSGSTGKAAALEGFRFIGIEKEQQYILIARARIEHAAYGDLA